MPPQVVASAEEAFPRRSKNEPNLVVTEFRHPGISGAVLSGLKTKGRVD